MQQYLPQEELRECYEGCVPETKLEAVRCLVHRRVIQQGGEERQSLAVKDEEGLEPRLVWYVICFSLIGKPFVIL
jgi:hypothetical protein